MANKTPKTYLCASLHYNLLKMNKAVAGFSKLSKEEKINWIATTYFSSPENAIQLLKNTGIVTKNFKNYMTNL